MVGARHARDGCLTGPTEKGIAATLVYTSAPAIHYRESA